jgi:hypothetical protein
MYSRHVQVRSCWMLLVKRGHGQLKSGSWLGKMTAAEWEAGADCIWVVLLCWCVLCCDSAGLAGSACCYVQRSGVQAAITSCRLPCMVAWSKCMHGHMQQQLLAFLDSSQRRLLEAGLHPSSRVSCPSLRQSSLPKASRVFIASVVG